MFGLNILFLTIFISSSQVDNTQWKKGLDKDDIVIYTRSVEGSGIKEFLAIAEMSGTKERFREIITDFDNYTDWSPDCRSVEVIEQEPPDDFTYHMRLKVPFPFTKRDIVQQLILKESEKELHIRIINRPSKKQELDEYVRMQKGDGEWLIKQISSDIISVRFQYLADPGGGIPDWLVNSFIVKNPYKSLQNIRQLMD
jgi:ribosome-associated toxin RatA of RatAB toxin-antitoxin module